MLLSISEIHEIHNSIIESFTSKFQQPSVEVYEERSPHSVNLLQNGKIVQIPARTRKCLNHNQWSFDLLDIYQESAFQEMQCQVCNAKFTQSDLILDSYWYSFIRQFNNKCQYININRDMCYQKVFRQTKYTRQLENNQELIYSLYERKDDQYSFSKIRKQDKFIDQYLNEFEYSAICLQDHVKLNIPVRFKDCKHIGAYELSSLLCKFNEVIEIQQKVEKEEQQNYNSNKYYKQQYQYIIKSIKKFYQCRQPGCNVRINYDINDLTQNLVLDYELLQAIKLSHPSAIIFQIKNRQGKSQFEEDFSDEKDQFIKDIWNGLPKETQALYPNPSTEKIKLSSCYKEFYSIILELFKRIFSNQDEEKVLKAILKPSKYQRYQISLLDNIANRLIEYPARCIKCRDINKCLDLRTLISLLLNQKRQDPEQLGLICPMCEFNHNPKKIKKSIVIDSLLYLDNQLLAQMNRDNRNTWNNILQYDGKKILMDEFKRNQVITIDQTRIEMSKFYDGKIVGTNDILRDPLLLFTCPNENRFNYDYVYEKLKISGFKSNELLLCKCESCNNQYQSIQDLYYDELLASIIPKIPNKYDVNLPIKYDTERQQFIILNNFTYKGFMPNNLKHKLDILGIIVASDLDYQEPSQVENDQKLIIRYNRVAGKDQFKKWKLSISSIQFNVDFSKIEK